MLLAIERNSKVAQNTLSTQATKQNNKEVKLLFDDSIEPFSLSRKILPPIRLLILLAGLSHIVY